MPTQTTPTPQPPTQDPDAPSVAGSDDLDTPPVPLTLTGKVYYRRAEYTRLHRIKAKIGTWNVAACPGTDKDLASWFVDGKGLDSSANQLSVDSAAAAAAAADSKPTEPKHDSDEKGEQIRRVGGDGIGLYVLGLQEVTDLGSISEYVSMYPDQTHKDKWRAAIEDALPPGYKNVSTERMQGLLLLIYASPDVAATITSVHTTSIGTGMINYLGNKGAVISRIFLGDSTSMVFVNSHLASGADTASALRRCRDVASIQARAQLPQITIAGADNSNKDGFARIGDEDFAFWLGDLNYRMHGLPGDDIKRILTLHSRGEYDLSTTSTLAELDGEPIVVSGGGKQRQSLDRSQDEEDGASIVSAVDTGTESSASGSTEHSFDESSITLPDPDEFSDPHQDPASLQATIDSLLPHDELMQAMREDNKQGLKAFHDGWREGPITFLPSYKYDVGTVALFDTSDKHRAPSWCDRILYRTRRDLEKWQKQKQDEKDAKKRDEDMRARGLDRALDDDEVLFSYDASGDPQQRPTFDLDYDEYDEFGDEAENDATAIQDTHATKDSSLEDRIRLHIYTSHQRIMSSDHKPVSAIFTIDYDAVVPELKAKVHADVARDLDRAENEGRPVVTLIIDNNAAAVSSKPDGGSDSDDHHFVDFHEVAFLRRQTRSLTIANTGRVAATLSFVEKPSTKTSSPPDTQTHWLKTRFVKPDTEDDNDDNDDGDSKGMRKNGSTDSSSSSSSSLGSSVTLEPGETVSGRVELYIDDISMVRELNNGTAHIEDVLVLRVDNGRDYFLPVRGTWLPTCFGRSVEELIRLPEQGGVRALSKPISPETDDVTCAAPRELIKLTEALEELTERAVADESMLADLKLPREVAGWPFEDASHRFSDRRTRIRQKLALIDALDHNKKELLDCLPADDSARAKMETVASVLVLFLRSMAGGIITPPLWAQIDSALPSITTIVQTASTPLTSPTTPTSPSSACPHPGVEDAKTKILDLLTSSPNHNICFVFLTTTLSKVCTLLAPEPPAETVIDLVPILRIRSLSFRLGGGAAAGSAAGTGKQSASLRHAGAERERRTAAIIGTACCRATADGVAEQAATAAKEKERRALEDRMRAVVEVFFKT